MRQNEASSTAVLVAAGLVFLATSKKTAPLVSAEAVKLGHWLLENYSSRTRWALSFIHNALFRTMVLFLEWVTLPDIVEHYAQRKRVLESLARASMEEGSSQLVVLGAGFDTLSLRFAREFSALQVWEVDHPATQAWKFRGVESCGLQSPSLKFIAKNLTDFADVKRFPPDLTFILEEKTFWVAEGLLMYFSEDDVKHFFRMIRANSALGSRIAFTWVQTDANGCPAFARPTRCINRWLDQRREPFTWGIKREEMEGFLSALGFRLLEVPQKLTVDMDRLNVGEYIALAETQ